MSRFLFIWTAFLGMAVGFRRVEHPRILLLPARTGRRSRELFAHVYAVVGIVFFAVVGWYAIRIVAQQISFGETSPVLGLGMYLVSIPMALSAGLAMIAIALTVYCDPGSRRGIVDGDRSE